MNFEEIFYEVMWRSHTENINRNKTVYPLPWWVQQYFRHWSDSFNQGLFSSKETAFSSNAHYRYWNMVGVKDHEQNALVGQAGEIEPVYNKYSVSFFLFAPNTQALYFPQFFDIGGGSLKQEHEDGYLPIIKTTYSLPINVNVEQKIFATVVNQKSAILSRFNLHFTNNTSSDVWFCISVSPSGPSGVQRNDRSGKYISDRRISFMKYMQKENIVMVNSTWGPMFKTAPTYFGFYGNDKSLQDPQVYIIDNPYNDLSNKGMLNNKPSALDYIAGFCNAVFAWPIQFSPSNNTFSLDIILPIDDYSGNNDYQDLSKESPDSLEISTRTYWKNKLDQNGIELSLPSTLDNYSNLFKICRSNILMLADNGKLIPGPTLYDSFWIRDSSIAGIATALVGDINLAKRQFGYHYPKFFNYDTIISGPVSLKGFWGGEHEKRDKEWDSNGQALWALGKLDRILGNNQNFGAGLYLPYIIEGARWIRENRSQYGLLHNGWSAEHIGDKEKPHYWDDYWALAGLWEAAKLAERIGATEKNEIWAIFDDLKKSTVDSITWVLNKQKEHGLWETFIPTGPADVAQLDSTIVGILAYFYPCRLYMNSKLGSYIDWAAKMSLDTIWAHFVSGGFMHDSAWNCYGPYLTLQLAHAFLLIGDIEKMDQCLKWSVDASFSKINTSAENSQQWQVVLGGWNEQHCYPIATNFNKIPNGSWYMGDMPHGWACAEYMMLLRDILFFEATEDNDPCIYIAPGIASYWLDNNSTIEVKNAPTIFGQTYGFKLLHDKTNKIVDIHITQPIQGVKYIYPCRFGSQIDSVTINGNIANGSVFQKEIHLPENAQHLIIKYS
ncbi:MAG: hypothetical protein H6Q71_2222 [Firmicutes bacterium]|nr:hypothetical protein [Bacillota bacterium]